MVDPRRLRAIRARLVDEVGGFSDHVRDDCGWLLDRLEELEGRQFPVLYAFRAPQGPRSVPWSWMRKFEAQIIANHSQDLEKLASRGGLDPSEIWLAAHGKRLSLGDVEPRVALVWLQEEPWRAKEGTIARVLDLEAALKLSADRDCQYCGAGAHARGLLGIVRPIKP